MATKTKSYVEVDLCRYVTASRGYAWGSSQQALVEYRDGQKAAKEKDIKKLVGEPVCLVVPNHFGYARPEFLSGLLRPLIRKQGLDETIVLVTATHKNMRDSLAAFFAKEGLRAKERAKKKAKEETLGDWSEPAAFFVPDIGTVVRLKEDWTFRLYPESRNYDMFQDLGIEYGSNYRWDWRLRDKGATDVVLRASTRLKVDRVYIRKGAKDYSSLTFNIQKGKDCVCVFKGREHVFEKKGRRFWAKLGDVNKMVVEVDRSTLAEN